MFIEFGDFLIEIKRIIWIQKQEKRQVIALKTDDGQIINNKYASLEEFFSEWICLKGEINKRRAVTEFGY